VLERGWLSSNNVLLFEGERAALVDSGYVGHAAQTVELLRLALDGRSLTRLVNTHSHSDHVGGNAAVRRAFGCTIAVPAGIAAAVAHWDEDALMLRPTAQRGERFEADATVAADEEIELGGLGWRALAVPGHDMDALAFYCAERRILISGDALWRDGFGIVFAEVLGSAEGLRAVRRTLEMLGRLAVDAVIPGHGAPFADFDDAMTRAWERVAAFEQDGERMARNALRGCFTFAMLDRRSMRRDEVAPYLASVPLYRDINARYFRWTSEALAEWLVRSLALAGAVRLEADRVVVAGGA
jgi:glyoxylase-like metal-dependent hydrolase (beta-lactamase superfamily II)